MTKFGFLRATKLTALSVSVLAITSTLAAPAPTKAGTPANAEQALNCAKSLASLPELNSTTHFEVGSVFTKPMKDQYEKQVAYEARVRQAFQDHQKALPIRRETLLGYKLVYKSWDLYDAEKEQFSITNPMYEALFNTGLGDQKFLSFTVANGGTQERSIGLGAKAKSSRRYGFALKLAPKDAGLRRRTITLKSSPAAARAIGNEIGIAIAAKPVTPWVADSYLSSTDYGTLTQSTYSTNVVVAEVLCAALVNTKTLEVLQILK